MGSKPHAPRTGPGFSTGKTPPAVAKGESAPHPKNSSGSSRENQTRRDGDSKSTHEGSGNWPGGDVAAMRKPY